MMSRWLCSVVVDTLASYGDYIKKPQYHLSKEVIKLFGKGTWVARQRIKTTFDARWADSTVSGAHLKAIRDDAASIQSTAPGNASPQFSFSESEDAYSNPSIRILSAGSQEQQSLRTGENVSTIPESSNRCF